MADRIINSDSEVGAVSFSADSNRLAGSCRDGAVRVWDVKTGEMKNKIELPKGNRAMTVPPASEIIGSADSEGTIKIWDLNSGAELRRIAGSEQRAGRLSVSMPSKLVAESSRAGSTGSEYAVSVWDGEGRRKFVVPAGLGGTAVLAFSPDGSTLVAAGYDTDLRAWSTRDGELLKMITQLPVSMFAVSFSPDGKLLATAGADRIVYLWDTKTWKLSRKLSGQPEMISAMEFSPDGRSLLTGGFSELTEKHPVKILLWDVASGKVQRTMAADHRVESATFAPNGALAATTTSTKQVHLWTLRQ